MSYRTIRDLVDSMTRRAISEAEAIQRFDTGVRVGVETVITNATNDESVTRAVAALDTHRNLAPNERMTHALFAAFGGRLAQNQDGSYDVVPLEDG
ncbi:hypothetical protein [Microbacterium lushaniae]|uniref:Uncharacterized protein n=1 Tax=Microbacterium lushaniae TaxID=2614639 RepID=A0A5J6L885_9MICO|nr:hypothetical protein [Microbacterium lushaniae]QEW04630.1 hypothetical protein F6J85_17085 [Microbacterium lushaniae]